MKEDWRNYPVQYIKGVGPKRSETLARLGILTVSDLLYHMPRRYEDRSKITPIGKLEIGGIYTITGKIAARVAEKTFRGYSILRVAIDDGTGIIYAVWFNQPYLEKEFPVGSRVILSGKISVYKEMQIQNPAYEVISNSEELFESGCIVPIYPLTRELTVRKMRKIYREALNRFGTSISEYLPFGLRQNYSFMNLPQALRKVHFPENETEWENARRRLIFDEFFMMQLALAGRKLARSSASGTRHTQTGKLIQILKEKLPFQLTKAQIRVIEEVRRDMVAKSEMNRLIQGEVGSGKTIVAIAAIVTAVEMGVQSALMAPTEILAEQHYLSLQKYLIPLGIRVGILVGGLSREMKEETLKEIKTGQCDIIVGTHALLEERVSFQNLGLAIVDEQHKFGVKQRQELKEKGISSCDLLMMSATPIPRSLAMTVYGDLDISTIDEVPSGRGEINTYLVSEEERDSVFQFIREEVEKGRQAYIVYPLIVESNASHLRALEKMAAKLRRETYPHLTIGLLHGKLPGKEKEQIMSSFAKGEIDILASTTVVEVGIDVPNASVMLIENPEQFGLAQLHQMRGRIGRGDCPSYCILLGTPGSEEAKRRLDVIVQTSDGFQIAEEDLDIRGPGEFLGKRQHGMPELKLGSISSDFKLLEDARKEAFALLGKDPELSEPRHKKLKLILQQKFSCIA